MRNKHLAEKQELPQVILPRVVDTHPDPCDTMVSHMNPQHHRGKHSKWVNSLSVAKLYVFKACPQADSDPAFRPRV